MSKLRSLLDLRGFSVKISNLEVHKTPFSDITLSTSSKSDVAGLKRIKTRTLSEVMLTGIDSRLILIWLI